MKTIREVTTFIPPEESPEEVSVNAWWQLTEEYEEKLRGRRWIFRGHDCQCRPFESSLHRAMKECRYSANSRLIEHNLMREFKRRAHHYLPNPPELNDSLQWLSLMRHYGAPTRLLDWSYSFWVATYFAVENLNPHFDYDSEIPKDPKVCRRPAHAVWAIDADWCREAANAKLGRTGTTDFLQQNGDVGSHDRFEQFLNTQELMAYPVNPFRLNERVVAQQAVFLCPGNVEQSFDENLAKMNPPPHKIVCIRIGPQFREEFIKELERMNISRAVLFPGLEGFATSLKFWMWDYDRLHTKLSDSEAAE